MGRIVVVGLLTAAALAAQEKPGDSSALLRDTATRKAAEWDALAQGLNRKIVRLLPCDPRVREAIEELRLASEARLDARTQYLRAAAEAARDKSAETRQLISNQEAFAAVLNTERAETEAELAAMDGQLRDLAESAKQRPQLGDAQKTLTGIAGIAQQRVLQTQEQASRNTALRASLRELDQSYQKEQTALDNELGALAAETARWSEYYTARLKRAQTECAITNGAAALDPPPARGKKQ